MIVSHHVFGMLGWWFEGGGCLRFRILLVTRPCSRVYSLPYDIGAEV